VRELGAPAEAVWRVVFEEEKAVVLASRAGRTVMEVWSFAPPPDQMEEVDLDRFGSRTARSLTLANVPVPAPYQEPMYGDAPSYGQEEFDKQTLATAASAAATAAENEDVMTRQDEVMADVYSQTGVMADDEGVAGPSGVSRRET
jgi:F-box and WD-40 domain protein CDC4